MQAKPDMTPQQVMELQVRMVDRILDAAPTPKPAKDSK